MRRWYLFGSTSLKVGVFRPIPAPHTMSVRRTERKLVILRPNRESEKAANFPVVGSFA